MYLPVAMNHNWVLLRRHEKWCDWKCERCGMLLITGPDADPGVDCDVWKVHDCDDEIIRSVQQS